MFCDRFKNSYSFLNYTEKKIKMDLSENSSFFLILYWFFTVILKNTMHFYNLDPIKNHYQSLRSKHSFEYLPTSCVYIYKKRT